MLTNPWLCPATSSFLFASCFAVKQGPSRAVSGNGKPLVDCPGLASGVGVCEIVTRVVNRDDSEGACLTGAPCRIDGGVPANNRAVLGGKEKSGWSGRRLRGNIEPPCGADDSDVEHRSCWRPNGAARIDRIWDRHGEALLGARRIVERRHPSVVVRHPEGRGRRCRKAPWVHKVWVGGVFCGDLWQVGNEKCYEEAIGLVSGGRRGAQHRYRHCQQSNGADCYFLNFPANVAMSSAAHCTPPDEPAQCADAQSRAASRVQTKRLKSTESV